VDDPWWNVKVNRDRIEAGDELFIYTGDGDRGIIGFARVIKSRWRNGVFFVRLEFDLAKCRALLDHPVPAPVIRGWIHYPRQNVRDLGPFAKDLYSRLPWKHPKIHHGSSVDFADASAIEGIKVEARRLLTKRSRRLRELAFKKAKGVCCVCERDFSKTLAGRGVRVLQVHHRKQLSARDCPSVTNLSDLAVVCANCHLLLHIDRVRAMKIRTLRRALRI
jgi:hypothetical protein